MFSGTLKEPFVENGHSDWRERQNGERLRSVTFILCDGDKPGCDWVWEQWTECVLRGDGGQPQSTEALRRETGLWKWKAGS